MKIEGLNSTTALGGSAKPKAARASQTDAPTAPKDSVQIGSASVAAAGAEAPLDTARVEAIRQAISEGRFQINPEAIADRLIQSARELVAAQREA